jgi:hypothetical protein
MKEFMLLIRQEPNHVGAMSPEQKQEFLLKVQTYIGNLMKEGKLKSAQPLVSQGKMISGHKGAFKDGPFNESKELIVGYYHIVARDLDEAVAIAKGNPELEYTKTARIEVRPIKMIEESIGFEYPNKA